MTDPDPGSEQHPGPGPGPGSEPDPDADARATVSWRELVAQAEQRLDGAGIDTAAAEARWIVEEVSGNEGPELALALGEPATIRAVARFDQLLARRAGGEPLQYVLGSWPFRTLDLFVDPRVLIPRPETEVVAGLAIAELQRRRAAVAASTRLRAVDLGTGSGAIALSIAAECPGVDVWATDRSTDALAVARANLAGLGRRGSAVALAEGSWFDALDDALRATFDLVVSNPPYIGADEVLPREVADWEPSGALVAGPAGTEDLDVLVDRSIEWLAPTGSLVLELAPHQAGAVAERARSVGFVEVEVISDLTGRDRAVLARRVGSTSSGA